MTIQVCKHLLTARKPDIQEEHHRDGLVSEIRILFECKLNRGTAMLAVVDHERRFHRNVQETYLARCGLLPERLQRNVTKTHCSQGSEDVVLPVIRDVPGD